MKRLCKHCDKEFEAKSNSHKYCTHDCLRTAYDIRRRANRIPMTFERKSQLGKHSHETRIRIYGKELGPKFKSRVRSIIRRRLKLGGGSCLIGVKSVARQAMTDCGRSVERTEQAYLEAAYSVTAELFERAGGTMYCYNKRNSRFRVGNVSKVYKFDTVS